MVQEALNSSFKVEGLVFSEDHLKDNDVLAELVSADQSFVAPSAAFRQLSSLQHPEGVLAILHLPASYLQPVALSALPPGKILLLDEIQDPGNLGTLIRTADWFGIRQIICRKGTVDCFNPKVLRSSMGSIFRIALSYEEALEPLIQSAPGRVWLADMEGTALGEAAIGGEDCLLLGNEANGVRDEIKQIAGIRKLHIPGRGGAESLNVSVAGGILLYFWK